ncbi:hypothetical protein KR222_005986, partial [Zaprionus bogoriensis]
EKKNVVVFRYTRADLLALRFDEIARQRPVCASRHELQTLNFWKINGFATNSGSSNPSYNTKVVSSPDREKDRDRDRETTGVGNANNLMSSRRALRNRERAHNYYQRFSSSDQISGDDGQSIALSPGNLTKTSYKTLNIVDHRSISSSHLMPAFAKRRFAISTGEISNEIQNHKPVEDISNRKDHSNTMRLSNNLLGSPMRSDKQTNLPDMDIDLATSPTFLAGRQGGERRIGSGRLVPHDNWEYKHKDTEILNTENLQNGSITTQVQRTFSLKQNERVTGDNLADRRVHVNDNTREQMDGKKNNIQGGRRTANNNKEKLNFCEAGHQSRGKRSGANLYQIHDRHEPEWFSAGPTSQHETIDLRGFDDSDEEPVSSSPIDQAATVLSRSSSVESLSKVKQQACTKDLNGQNSKQSNTCNIISISKSEVEFNFDAFLNLDPMEHTIMGNENKVQSEFMGTSRFSQWFAANDPVHSNSKPKSLGDGSMHDTQGIPSVKDLEAQMAKVDLRPTNIMLNNSKEITEQPNTEKQATRDTEAFKRLLQQLGSQTNSPQTVTESYQSLPNASGCNFVRVPNRSNVPSQHITRVFQESESKGEDAQHPQQRKKSEPQMTIQSQLFPSYISDSKMSGHLPVQEQKRIEAQHLLQGVLRGDISLDTLEKEINNPNTAALTKEVIATVIYECSNSVRNTLQPNNNFTNICFILEIFTQHIPPTSSIGQQQNSQHRHSISPTPLAFTPTSVLRKMTADKETTPNISHFYLQNTKPPAAIHSNLLNDSSPMSSNSGINLQPRMILGGNFAIQQPHHHQLNSNNPQMPGKPLPQLSQIRCQPQVKWSPGGNMPQAKTFGRPILKGTLNSGNSQQQMSLLTFSSNNEMQQIQHQHRLKSLHPPIEAINNENIQNAPYNDGISQINQHPYLHHQPQQQQRQQTRYRLLHGQNNIPMHSVSSEASENNCLNAMNYHRGTDAIDRISPTTNQLAQWFSPELLARASAGKLPLLNMDQALSLEDFERSMQHSSATVLN